MVALLEAGDAASDIDDDTGALMAEDRRKEPLRIGPGQGEGVGMANPGRLDFDQHFAVFRSIEPYRLDRQRLSGLVSNSGTSLHRHLPPIG